MSEQINSQKSTGIKIQYSCKFACPPDISEVNPMSLGASPLNLIDLEYLCRHKNTANIMLKNTVSRF